MSAGHTWTEVTGFISDFASGKLPAWCKKIMHSETITPSKAMIEADKAGVYHFTLFNPTKVLNGHPTFVSVFAGIGAVVMDRGVCELIAIGGEGVEARKAYLIDIARRDFGGHSVMRVTSEEMLS